MLNRFDSIEYDTTSKQTHLALKELVMMLEQKLTALNPSRTKSLALTSLEEAYGWMGKAVRDDQIARAEED